ncbi:hypothetical protein QYE76_040646 [Lolium multiflorum]|uniref:60S ribosomal protein L13a n=1 Tax=Lolium multiflorum TaxID=4521 RepID=A0AAD8TD59_LOLMU|nr:hypothetical protein QYE76_040646 [Lolium multiflorum]
MGCLLAQLLQKSDGQKFGSGDERRAAPPAATEDVLYRPGSLPPRAERVPRIQAGFLIFPLRGLPGGDGERGEQEMVASGGEKRVRALCRVWTVGSSVSDGAVGLVFYRLHVALAASFSQADVLVCAGLPRLLRLLPLILHPGSRLIVSCIAQIPLRPDHPPANRRRARKIPTSPHLLHLKASCPPHSSPASTPYRVHAAEVLFSAGASPNPDSPPPVRCRRATAPFPHLPCATPLPPCYPQVWSRPLPSRAHARRRRSLLIPINARALARPGPPHLLEGATPSPPAHPPPARGDKYLRRAGPVEDEVPMFLRKRMNTKPSHGPIHYRAPSCIFWRTVRGMIPHKAARGEAALARLKAFVTLGSCRATPPPPPVRRAFPSSP